MYIVPAQSKKADNISIDKIKKKTKKKVESRKDFLVQTIKVEYMWYM